MTLKEIQRRAIEDALRRHGGNKSRAALELGVSIRSMRNWCNAGVTQHATPAKRTAYGPGYLNTVINTEIERAMLLANGHKHRAAQMLGMTYSTLYKRLKVNPSTERWTSKRHAKPAMLCTQCNGRMNARSWITTHTITRTKDYIVRRGPGRSIWYCIRYGAGRKAYIEAKNAATKATKALPASPLVSSAEAKRMRKELQRE